MKKTILISAITLLLISILAANWHDDDSCGEPSMTLTFHPSMGDTVINPTNSDERIDSTMVEFLGMDEQGLWIDTSGVLELSVGTQLFSLKIKTNSPDCMQQIDSLRFTWRITGASPTLNVLYPFQITTGYKSEVVLIDSATVIGNTPSVSHVRMKFAAEIEPELKECEISGGLAVVVITIDPSDLPEFTPIGAEYKMKNDTAWNCIPWNDAQGIP